MSLKTSFSGHEKFDCKMSWLPLAYKNIEAIYNDLETAISITGLGSNKIKSLKQWMRKLTLFTGVEFSANAETILSNDPYLEKLESLWILHTYITQNFKKQLYTFYFLMNFLYQTLQKNRYLKEQKSGVKNKI